jgi:ferredoxin
VNGVETADLGEGITLTVRLGREMVTTRCRTGMTLLQMARSTGLHAPSACQTGTCAACMARVTRGEVDMRHNDALTPEEVAHGWVLSCQSVPLSNDIEIVYE